MYTYDIGTGKSKNRHKYLLQFSYEICQRHKVIIKYMETDKDHIHYMIETEPTMSVSKDILKLRNRLYIEVIKKILQG
ncbi:MAG: transposase, partial [Bacilli bacterium]|nr:transposase [Bacilli bacterium]